MNIREELAAAHLHYSNINGMGFDPDLATLLLRAIEEHADLEAALRQARAALVQARGALLLDAMVDDDGKPFGTTAVALDAIDAALVQPTQAHGHDWRLVWRCACGAVDTEPPEPVPTQAPTPRCVICKGRDDDEVAYLCEGTANMFPLGCAIYTPEPVPTPPEPQEKTL